MLLRRSRCRTESTFRASSRMAAIGSSAEAGRRAKSELFAGLAEARRKDPYRKERSSGSRSSRHRQNSPKGRPTPNLPPRMSPGFLKFSRTHGTRDSLLHLQMAQVRNARLWSVFRDNSPSSSPTTTTEDLTPLGGLLNAAKVMSSSQVELPKRN